MITWAVIEDWDMCYIGFEDLQNGTYNWYKSAYLAIAINWETVPGISVSIKSETVGVLEGYLYLIVMSLFYYSINHPSKSANSLTFFIKNSYLETISSNNC